MCFSYHATSTTQIYTLSLHDALPILWMKSQDHRDGAVRPRAIRQGFQDRLVTSMNAIEDADREPGFFYCNFFEGKIMLDRKSTRLNSSHSQISYAVFCLKKKKKKKKE